ncbi:MAG: hypothetical protein R2736_18735 [Solirubrobacterales bacterium]
MAQAAADPMNSSMSSDSPSKPRLVRWTVRALVTLGASVVVVLCLIGVYAVLAATLVHGSVNERSLFQSVSRVAGSAFPDIGGPCKKPGEAPDAAWSCAVGDKAGSGFARSRATVTAHSSCWKATLVVDRSEGRMPETFDGCVRRVERSPF